MFSGIRKGFEVLQTEQFELPVKFALNAEFWALHVRIFGYSAELFRVHRRPAGASSC